MWRFLRAISDFLAHCGIRCALWILAIVAALFPSLHASRAALSADLADLGVRINTAGFFRDFFFIVVVVSVIGLSNVLYAFIINNRRVHIWSGFAGVIAIGYFAYILIYGTSRFDEIAKLATSINPADLGHDLDTIRNTLVVGFFTEIIVAFTERRAYVRR
jgi:hypothetical protein